MPSPWSTLLFETCEAGISSAVTPELLRDNQNAWMLNGQNRGGKPATRPNMAFCLSLPTGLIQGGEFFSVQGGMIVVSIAGRMYRIRINNRMFSFEEIALSFVNSPVVKQVWMTQTIETLVIQDGQSNPILYNGSTAPRAVTGQVPRGRMMAYGNGRLWVAINANEVVAGDIRTNTVGSELDFTEVNYLTGGGRLFFQNPLSGLAFIPVTGQSDYGALLVFGVDETHAIRADVTSRDQWAQIPGFVTNILRSVGASCQWSIASVNQDLFWRDSNRGIRSIRNALADESGPGSSPVSREVSRLTDYDSQRQLIFSSSIYHDNRLLMTSSPYLLRNGGVGFKNLIALDFAPLSTLSGKAQAAYDGQWNGLDFVKLVAGKFLGRNRAFSLVTDAEGNNQLWEFGTGERGDQGVACAEETVFIESPITSLVEYPLRDFGQSKTRKRLERCDVWLSQLDGPLDLSVYWRADNAQKWQKWDEAITCAQTTDPVETTPHVWKNLLSQERPQFKTFTIPDSVNDVVKYANSVGFEFQIRLVWTGHCRIHRMMAYGTMLTDPDYADRSGFAVECVENDVTGNEITYVIPTGGCPAMTLDGVACGSTIDFGQSARNPIQRQFTITNTGEAILNIGTVSVSGDGYSVLSQPVQTRLGPGEQTFFTILFTPTGVDDGTIPGVITIPSDALDSPCVVTGNTSLTTPLGALVCDSEAGVGQLVGFPAYKDPATPPILYLIETVSGNEGVCQFVSAQTNCAQNSDNNINYQYHGTNSFDSITGLRNPNAQFADAYSTNGVPCPNAPDFVSTIPFLSLGQLAHVLTIVSSTLYESTPVLCASPFSGIYFSGFGTGALTLSTPDTPLNAISRAVKTPGSSCTAKMQEWASPAFSFLFVVVGYDVNCTDLVVGLNYRVRVEFNTENYDGGGSTLSHQDYFFTAVASNQTISDVIDCPVGKQVTVQNATIVGV